jgi:hypothetical protein
MSDELWTSTNDTVPSRHSASLAVANKTENCLHQMTTLFAAATSEPAGTA